MFSTQKILVEKPVVDIDGDEMTRVIWDWIKSKLILSPHLELAMEHARHGMQKGTATVQVPGYDRLLSLSHLSRAQQA